ncbi:MAG: RluA family pseudouridine synthase [Desulfosarcinaceae bacterium]|nr:RluA family pseudouridine synthase [Desulfosarcinaceae bacterium]
MSEDRKIHLTVQPAETAQRLDLYLSEQLPACSRSEAARLVKGGAIRVDGKRVKPAYRLMGGETITGCLPAPTRLVARPEAIPLDILYEDRDIIVINKAAGIVVHPAPGHPGGTLVNALLYHCGDLSGLDGDIRPGIVHRLDRDTSGILIVAKHASSQRALAEQFKSRLTRKWYRAIVVGQPKTDSGRCEAPIGRHPVDRKRMSIRSRQGRSALTVWTVVNRWGHFAELELEIRTGRTHQIRVHCAAMGHPVLGDEVYGPSLSGIQKSGRWPGREPLKDLVNRQMLHAMRLCCTHPTRMNTITFTAPLASDIEAVRSYLAAE